MDYPLLSPRFRKLYEEVQAVGIEALEVFYSEMHKKGTPLIEVIEGDKYSLLTVLWFEDRPVKNIHVIAELFGGEIFGEEAKESNLFRFLDTNLWYRTFKVRNDARSVYGFVANFSLDDAWKDEDIFIDPLNPRIWKCPKDEDHPENQHLLFDAYSVVELPKARNGEWPKVNPGVPRGKLEKFMFQSGILQNERRVWIYTPYRHAVNEDLGIAVFFDGWEYLYMMETNIVLDNMITAGKILPVFGVFVESIDRSEELGCSDKFNEFIIGELLPWVENKLGIELNPCQRLVSGFSRGGLAAAYLGLSHPNIFGKVIAQSGAFHWHPEQGKTGWLIERFAKAEKKDIKLYLDRGTYEWWEPGNTAIEQMLEVLRNKGYSFWYQEFPGGHIYMDWKYTLPDALMFLL